MNKLWKSFPVTIVALILCAGVVRADSIDLNALNLSITSLSGCPTSSCFGWDPRASSITLTLPSSGTLQFATYNGSLAHSIRWIAFTVPMSGLNVSCAGTVFASCMVTNPYPNVTRIRFSVGSIAPGQYFSINFGCASGSCSWPSGLRVVAHTGIETPEPGALTLVLTGIAAILTRRKLSSSKTDS
jgi:hypothetical protein